MKSASPKVLLVLVIIAVIVGAVYLYINRSSLLNSQETNNGAYIGQSFPPILFLDYKAGIDKGCYEMKWSALNVTSCTSTWRPSIHTNGVEQVCQGKADVEGVRSIGSNVGEMTYSVSCTGVAGSVSRTIKIKNN